MSNARHWLKLLNIPAMLRKSAIQLILGPGRSAPNEMKNALNRPVKVLADTMRASTGALVCTVLSGARDIATKRRPIRAAPAVAAVTKKLVYSEGTMGFYFSSSKLFTLIVSDYGSIGDSTIF